MILKDLDVFIFGGILGSDRVPVFDITEKIDSLKIFYCIKDVSGSSSFDFSTFNPLFISTKKIKSKIKKILKS